MAHYKARIVEIKQDLLTSRIDKETTKELQKRQEDLTAAKVAAELTIKQSQYEAAQTEEFARIEQLKHKEEVQRIQDLIQQQKELRVKDQLDSEKEKEQLLQTSRQKVLALENIVKEHNVNMKCTEDLVTALPELLQPSLKQRILDLQSLIDANVPDDAK